MGFAVVCVFDTHFLIYHQDRTLIIRDRGRGGHLVAASLPNQRHNGRAQSTRKQNMRAAHNVPEMFHVV